MLRILVVDDEEHIREGLRTLLGQGDREVLVAADGVAARLLLQQEAVHLVVSDLRMPYLDGLGLLEWCRREGPDLPFVMISAHGDVGDAVRAMKLGASDYVTKPFDPDELELRISQALEAWRQRAHTPIPGVRAPTPGGSPSVSPAWQRIETLVAKVAPTRSLVLITGESGTGKEVLARRIHDLSPQAAGPFVAVNLGAVPGDLMESELFGHEKGAFTGADSRKTGMFERAAGGTLLLDEIGEVPLLLQVKLLRVLQERKIQRLGGSTEIPFDARVLAATNRNLEAEVAAGRFRQDLYYRLNVVPLTLPPLRERKEDLPWLVDRLAERLARRNGVRVPRVSPAALERLGQYDFPGNIRELENLVERAMIFNDLGILEPEDFDLPAPPEPWEAEGSLARAEMTAIREALERTGGNRTQAARLLGISRRTLFSKLRQG